jgi:hypothetical protein
MKNKILKSIGYAYPTSNTAKRFGFESTGCHFIQYQCKNIEGSGHDVFFADEQVGVFEHECDQLKASFDEAEGEICPMWLKYKGEK